MNEPPREEPRLAPDQRVVQVRRVGEAVRLRFEDELRGLVDDIHELREVIHGHPLPRDGSDTERAEDQP